MHQHQHQHQRSMQVFSLVKNRFALLLLLVASIVATACAPAAMAQKQPTMKPDLGPNVLIFDPSMPQADMQQQIDKIYAVERRNEFGPERYAILFLPGEYHLDVPVGFYTQVLGLGATPDAVHIVGNVHADASHDNNNATTTFWRAAEGFSITPAGGTMQWAVSQAVAFRRMRVRGDIVLHQHHGWASGGWMSDTLVDGNVDSGSQQQWISRNSEWKSWTGSNWNMVFVGVPHPPDGDWPQPPYTKVAETPVVREKPFLQVDEKGKWSVCVPGLRDKSVGIMTSRHLNPPHLLRIEGGARPAHQLKLVKLRMAIRPCLREPSLSRGGRRSPWRVCRPCGPIGGAAPARA